jgi:uncharacterized coiled-coil DUF342 family protein
MMGIHPLESRRWAAFADVHFPKLARAAEKIGEGIGTLAALADETLKELAELRQYKEEVQDEADHWIEQIETLFIESAKIEHLDTDEALRLLRETQTFLMEKVNEGKSAV